jgi:hypothetical protein
MIVGRSAGAQVSHTAFRRLTLESCHFMVES